MSAVTPAGENSPTNSPNSTPSTTPTTTTPPATPTTTPSLIPASTSATSAPSATPSAVPSAVSGIAPSSSTPVSRKSGGAGSAAAQKKQAQQAQQAQQQLLQIASDSNSFKKYQFGDELGKGAFGRVFRGLNITSGEVVAIKQIEKEKIKESLPQILKELERLRELDHPNIVKFIEYIDTKDFLYFTLEFVEGGSLYATMRRFGSFPESLLVIYITQVLRGIQYLHKENVIHRDIKGANILLTKEGQCKLADFGSCTYEALTKGNETTLASPFWMAPEIIEQKKAVPASDIWSLGCTLVELLTGKPPYWDLGAEQAVNRILQDQCPPFPPNLSADLEEFLRSCFVRDPAQRPTAEKLLQSAWISKLWGGSDNSLKDPKNEKSKRKSIKIPKTLEWSFKLPGLSSQVDKTSSSPTTPSAVASAKSPRGPSTVTPDPDLIKDMMSKDRSTRTVNGSVELSADNLTGGMTSPTGAGSGASGAGGAAGTGASGGTAGTGGAGEGSSSEKEGMMQNILELTEQLGRETDEKKALQRSVEELKARLEKLASEKDNLMATLKDLKSQANAEQKAMVDELRDLLQKLTSSDSNNANSSTPAQQAGAGGSGIGPGGDAGAGLGAEETGWMVPGARCIAMSAKLGQPYDAIISSASVNEPGYYRVIFIGFGDEAELPASALRPYDDGKKGKKTGGDRYRLWRKNK